MKSLSEIETTVKRASKAAGYSWGVSEETGKSIRLLELFSLPGIKHLNEYFNEKNTKRLLNERNAIYAEADITITIDKLDKAKILQAIIKSLESLK